MAIVLNGDGGRVAAARSVEFSKSYHYETMHVHIQPGLGRIYSPNVYSSWQCSPLRKLLLHCKYN